MSDFGARVTIDPVELAAFVRSPNGPIFRYMSVVGEAVKQRARARVGVWQPEPGDPFAGRRIARRRPGTLRDRIVKRVTQRNNMPLVIVGADDPVAFIHHEGTPPHIIRARLRPALVFFAHGHVHRRLVVNHPGTKPNRYLTDAIADVRRQFG